MHTGPLPACLSHMMPCTRPHNFDPPSRLSGLPLCHAPPPCRLVERYLLDNYKPHQLSTYALTLYRHDYDGADGRKLPVGERDHEMMGRIRRWMGQDTDKAYCFLFCAHLMHPALPCPALPCPTLPATPPSALLIACP